MFNRKLKMAIIAVFVVPLGLSGCTQLEALKDKLPAISLPGGESSADRAHRLTTGRTNQVLRNICFSHLFESVPLETVAATSNAVSVASPGARPSPLPETVWSYRDTPFLAFWGGKKGAGCNIGVFDGDLDATLAALTETMRERFGRQGSTAPNPFINLPVRTHSEIKTKEVGPITVMYEGRTFSLRITAQTLKDPVSDTLPGYVFSLNVLS